MFYIFSGMCVVIMYFLTNLYDLSVLHTSLQLINGGTLFSLCMSYIFHLKNILIKQ